MEESFYDMLFEYYDNDFDRKTVFFKELDKIPPNELKIILTPFKEAIVMWGKVLLTLTSRLDDIKDRQKILKNIMDEHGINQDSHYKLDKTHVDTFEDFLNSMSYNNDDICIVETESIAVSRFNTLIKYFSESIEPGVCCLVLGSIEFIYVKISERFNRYLKNHGIKAHHYSEHETLDGDHAEDLFQVAANTLQGTKLYDDFIFKHYTKIGFNAILNLYDELLSEYRTRESVCVVNLSEN